MSDRKQISPLLDGYQIGDPINDHDGVCCCPAIKGNPENKYILKIITIPASQVQLDALLLTGAYREPSAALAYFKDVAEKVEKEAQCLQQLAKSDGFLCYDSWQTVPMEDNRLGYQVYLLGTYKRTLEKHMRRSTMTHLEAVNLGLDICAALSAARKAGWIYADLKPSNIFMTAHQEFRIGDLGFMELGNLKYASLPGKYRNAYTAPELEDDLCSPNTTIDTYALGKILYQIFNNGILEEVDYPTENPLPPPVNADYEIAEIIMKAISPDPANRWADPNQMEQALVAYMQRNGVNNTPITPPAADISQPGAEETEKTTDDSLPQEEDAASLQPGDISEETEAVIAQADAIIEQPLPEPPVVPTADVPEESGAEVRSEEEASGENTSDAEQSTGAGTEENVASEEQQPKKKKKKKKASDQEPEIQHTDLGIQRRKARRKAFAVTCLIILLLGLLAAGGYLFYQNYYLLHVDGLSYHGSRDCVTISVDAEFDTGLLTVVCTDTQGKAVRQSVTDGKASFEDLLPDMLYKIHLEVEGLHKLQGCISHEYMTPAETHISDFTAATGASDGSVALSFTVAGPDSENWTVICTAEDEETIEKSFSGHTVLVEGLTVGKSYSFRLVPESPLYIPSEATLEFTAAQSILAQELTVITDENGKLSVSWTLPEELQAESWTVRCYDGSDYDKQLTTNEFSAVFEGISPDSAYTVEVTAAGMTEPARATITANPIHVGAIHVDDRNPMALKVSWEFQGEAPAGGWLLMYTIDGSTQQQVVQCDENVGTIGLRIPAATYDISIQAADGRTVFNGSTVFDTSNVDVYENAAQAFYPKHQAHHFFSDLLPTPEKENWTHADVTKHNYTTTFTSGQKISVLLYYMQDFYIRHENIQVMYVIRNAEGDVLTDMIGVENLDWRDGLWKGANYHYCGLNVPNAPTEPGEYSLGVYFNGLAVTSLEFTITE